MHTASWLVRLDCGRWLCNAVRIGTCTHVISIPTNGCWWKVDQARKDLCGFWKDLRKRYKACRLVGDERRDFFAGRGRWLRNGSAFRTLVEPLDIANWWDADTREDWTLPACFISVSYALAFCEVSGKPLCVFIRTIATCGKS